MMRLSLSALAVLLPLLAVLVAQLPAVEARNRWCIPHGYDNRWAPKLGKGNMECYHHWQDGPVEQYSKNIEYIPMMWDLNRHGGLWAQRKRQMKNNLPARILAQNEPDVKGQANLDPITAAKDWVRELKPYQDKGVKISSPQIVYDLDWMDKFMTKLHQLGADVDFMAIHSYTPKGDKGLNQLKSFVQKVRKRYGKSVWVTEYGITAASNPSSAEVKDFVIKAQQWMDSTGYVKRSFPLGGFAVSQPPDAFVSNKMAFFSGNGQLRSVANWLVYSGKGRRDLSSLPSSPLEHRAAASPGAKRHHAKLANRAAARDQLDADLLEARDDDDADEKDGGDELPCTDADPYCGLGDKIAAQLERLVDGDWYEKPEDRDDDEEDID